MAEPIFDKVPLSKSLGFSIREDYGKTVKESRRPEYFQSYNELLKASKEFIGFAEDDNSGSDLIRFKRIADRRKPAHMQSSAGRRRARCQALRRQKLNSQSLRSHQQHSRHSSVEDMNIMM